MKSRHFLNIDACSLASDSNTASSQNLKLCYHLITNEKAPKRKLMLLHGSGVAGLLTWLPIAQKLNYWNEILIPDFRGMGETEYLDGVEHPFTLDDIVNDITGLLDHVGWMDMDIGGYSFGGLVAMKLKSQQPQRFGYSFLLEPAGLDRLDLEETREFRRNYHNVAKQVRDESLYIAGITSFLDQVSPDRSKNKKIEELTVARLAHRRFGFANALDAVSYEIEKFDRETLLSKQGSVLSFVGSKSHNELIGMHLRLQKLSSENSDYDWSCKVIEGTDHSLPFQKPKKIAQLINDFYSDRTG